MYAGKALEALCRRKTWEDAGGKGEPEAMGSIKDLFRVRMSMNVVLIKVDG